MHICVIKMPLVDKASRNEGSGKPSQKALEKCKTHEYGLAPLLYNGTFLLSEICHIPKHNGKNTAKSDTRWYVLIFDSGVLFSFHTGGRFRFHQNSRSVSQDRVCVQRGEQRGEGRRVGQRWSVKISLIWFWSADKSLMSLCTSLNFYFWIWIFSFSFSSHKPLDNDWNSLFVATSIFSFFTNIATNTACFVTDALLRKAFATPSFQGYNFVSSLLVLLGLLKVGVHAAVEFTLTIHSAAASNHWLVSAVCPAPPCSERGQGEACARGSWPPAGAGARGATGLFPQRECGCVGGFHVPVRA